MMIRKSKHLPNPWSSHTYAPPESSSSEPGPMTPEQHAAWLKTRELFIRAGLVTVPPDDPWHGHLAPPTDPTA